MSKSLPTAELQSLGFICRRVETRVMGSMIEHYAIYHAGARVSAPALTCTTARAAWDDLRREIAAGRIDI